MSLEKIGRYIIKEKLGHGGMATVYRAQDPRFKRDVAIKILPPALLDNDMFQARFDREAQMIASLEYPGIVPVYDFGEDEGQPYLVMRFMPGGSLSTRIRNGPLSLPEVTRIFSRLAPALDHVHTKGIVHRDIKPGNILFDQYNSAYISDFGIARINEGTISLTGDALIGTPAYMSPEQAQGLREIDGRSDIYAMGAILFESLTGKQPYEATTPMGVILKHITEPTPRLLTIKSDLPDELEMVINRSMEKDRDRRYQTASALSADLNRLLEELANGPIKPPYSTPIEPHPKTESQPVQKIEKSSDVAAKRDSATRLEPEQTPGQPSGHSTAEKPKKASPDSLAQSQILPVVPPFVLQQDEEARSPAQPDPRDRSAPSSPQRTSNPKSRRVLLWSLVGLLVISLGCLLLLTGGWIFSALFETPSTEVAQEIEPPISEQKTTLDEEISVIDDEQIYEYFDDFSDPDSGWWFYDGDEGVMDYQSGSFQIQVDIPDWYLLNSPGYMAVDTMIEVEAYKAGGPDENLFGVICRYQDSYNFYFLVVGSSGYFGIGKILDGEPILLSEEENPYSGVIHQGKTSNLLRADCIGNTLSLYANDTLLTEVVDDDFREGDVGLFVGTFDIYGVNILFDNFHVVELIQE